MPKFREPCQLHNHSMYSLLDAVPSPEEWVAWCLKTETPGFSITDHGNAISLFHAIRFPQMIEKYNKKNKTSHASDAVIGVPGVELYMKLNAEDKGHHHITAWAVNNTGYYNLMKLSSLAFQDTVSYFGSVKARITFDMIEDYREGIKFGTSCIAGPLGRLIMNDDEKTAEELYKQYIDFFGDDLYVEFHPNNLTHEFDKKTGSFFPFKATKLAPDGNLQLAYNKFLARMVDTYGGKPIPATDAHFIAPEDKIIQDCLLKNGNTNGWYFHESYHQLRADEIFDKLKVHLGDWLTEDKFQQWIENTYEIMNQAKDIEISYDYHLPAIEIPEDVKVHTSDYNMQTYLFMIQKIKKHGRWKDDPVYIERFKKEVDVIMKNETLNFIPYFLVYEDISQFARDQNILQNIARGSAGGSLLSYYLKIIHVDPIKANLPFERFLSHARIRAGSFPDIDMDIGDRARPLIMNYLREKYGLGFAQIATFNKMKTKNAIKDAMFALYGKNRNHPDVKQICNTIPDSGQGIDEKDFLYGFTDKEGNYHMGQVELNKKLARFFETYKDVEDMVKRVIGMPRGWSRHASAFVISTVDLSSSRVPTMIMKDKDIGALTVTQFDASMVEKNGLVKADILGIKTLTAVSDCIQMVKDSGGVDYLKEDENGIALIYVLPEDDGVYKDFYNKRTDSSFQFNTELVKGYIQQFNPTERCHLSALTALCRPGTLDAPFMNDEISLDDKVSAAQYYLDVRNNRRKLSYLHPDLATCTTNGVFVYQEEVMKFLVDIGGYTLEESDIIRGAIAKKKHDVMMASFDKIRKSTKQRGWTQEQSEAVCQQIQAFSKYSFNLSHSHAYAELGYITMYMKHHHNLEWWTSVLNSEISETKTRKYVSLLGDMVQPPSMKNPSERYHISGQAIASPISVIKGIGPKVVEELVNTGPFDSLEDFVSRVRHTKVNIGAISALISSRAADSLFVYDDDDMNYTYVNAREDFMRKYLELRKTKSKFADELWNLDPMSIFLMEREANTCFNKKLLENYDLVNIIDNAWPGLQKTGKDGIPFMMHGVPILSNIKVAEGMIKAGYKKDVAMILLFDGSSIRAGTSNKTGRPWKLTSIKMSDGCSEIEAVDWNLKKPLRWPKNTVIYVRGTLKEGWKSVVSINIDEIERIDI